MSPWKIILVMLAVLIPGGSLVLLAMATAKALVASRNRWLRHSVPVVQPIAANGGNG